MRKNILITGGAGFIGSNLAEELVKNYNVIAVDNFITSNVVNIEDLIRNPNFKFIKYDLTRSIKLEDFSELEQFNLANQGLSYIYHLACPTSLKNYAKVPLETALTNAYATRNGLDLAVKYQCPYILGSTAFVYGEVPPDKQPVREDYFGLVDPHGPRSCYNEGKRFAETLSVIYQNKFKLPIKIARLFNSYGPKMRLEDGRIIPDLVSAGLANQPVIIYGDQTTSATFCYIDDLIAGLIKLAESEETGTFNLGHPTKYTIKEVAEEIITIINSPSKIVYQEPFPFQPKYYVPDISQAKDKLAWLPIVTLAQGLAKTVESLQASKTIRLKEVGEL